MSPAAVAVVDDDAGVRAYALAVLRRAGYRVLVDDGADGVVARLTEFQPDLVLLDLQVAGWEDGALRGALRGAPSLAEVPVLAFSGGFEEDDLETRYGGGYRGFLSKPADPSRLVDAVHRALNGSVAAPDAAASDDYLAPLRRQFLVGLAERGRRLQQAVDAHDAAAVAAEAHRLAGAAGAFGFAALSAAAGAVERALAGGREGVGHASVVDLMELLREHRPAG